MENYYVAFAGLTGVVIGGLINLFMNYQLIKSNKVIREEEFKIKLLEQKRLAAEKIIYLLLEIEVPVFNKNGLNIESTKNRITFINKISSLILVSLPDLHKKSQEIIGIYALAKFEENKEEWFLNLEEFTKKKWKLAHLIKDDIKKSKEKIYKKK